MRRIALSLRADSGLISGRSAFPDSRALQRRQAGPEADSFPVRTMRRTIIDNLLFQWITDNIWKSGRK